MSAPGRNLIATALRGAASSAHRTFHRPPRAIRLVWGTLACLLVASAAWAGPGDSDDPFAATPTPPAKALTTRLLEQPEPVPAGSEVQLRFELGIPKDHWSYLERTYLEVLPSAGFELLGIESPEPVIKLDPFLEEEVEVYKTTTVFTARLRAGWDTEVVAVLHYQGCNESLCFFPEADTLRAQVTVTGDPVAVAGSDAVEGPAGEIGRLTAAADRGILWLLLLVFGAGFATSLTPCVYPMIPITIGIIGARSAGRRSKGFTLSLLYVLGISFTYSALGTTAAMTGSLFGNALQNIWVVGFVAVVFVIMGMSMFGAFELQVPARFAGRMNSVQGSGYPGAFLLGLIAGIVASPCIGPVLVAMLTYVGTQGSVPLGFLLFFTFSLGLGVLFVVLGTFTGLIASVPRSGNWMIAVKVVFGLIFIGVAIYFLHPLLPHGRGMLVAGAALLLAGLLLRGWRAIHEVDPAPKRWGTALGRVALVVGAYAVAVPLFWSSEHKSVPGPAWLTTEEQGIEVSQANGKPLLIDFSAEWCVACKELEHFTFSDDRVIALSEDFVPVRVDATKQTPNIQRLMKKYGIVGLPWVVFVTPNGTVLQNLTVTGFINADEMLQRMQTALDNSDVARASP